VWRNPKLKATAIEKLEPWHHFPDHDVVFWRSGWDAQATAIAFKCGPAGRAQRNRFDCQDVRTGTRNRGTCILM